MIAPHLFPALGMHEEMLIISGLEFMDGAQIPPGQYIAEYAGGGGGGAGQDFTYTYEQEAGKPGNVWSDQSLYLVHKSQLLVDLFIGSGGSRNNNGGSTTVTSDLPSAAGGAGGVTKQSPQTGKSSPSGVLVQEGVRSFNDPVSYTSSNRRRGGHGYKSGVSSGDPGVSGYVKLKKVGQ